MMSRATACWAARSGASNQSWRDAFQLLPYLPLGQYLQATSYSTQLSAVLNGFGTVLERDADRAERQSAELAEHERRWASVAGRDGTSLTNDRGLAVGTGFALLCTPQFGGRRRTGDSIVSIDSIASSTWTRPFQPQPGVGGSWNADPRPPSSTAGSTSTASGSGTSTVGLANPFQQLASDVQAMLVEAQGGTTSTSTATAASATGTATGASPEQQVANDLQTLLAQLQSGQPGSDPNAQSVTTGQAGAAGQAQPHHHHHHHGGGAGVDTATGAAGTTASSTASSTTAATTTSSGTPSSGSDQTVSRAFAADILQALQAYGSNASGATVPGLTA
jgi:hypothetical protein